MSRIGKLPIAVPKGVEVAMKDNIVTVKGAKGTLSQYVDPRIVFNFDGSEIILAPQGDSKEENSLHGLYRSLIFNMVYGVTEGYTSTLELVGVGFRASNKGQILELALGHTHPIFMMLPEEVKVETKSERNKNPLIIFQSADKQLLGQVCAKIRSFRKPEPYKGKGVKFEGEVIRRKSGKTASAK